MKIPVLAQTNREQPPLLQRTDLVCCMTTWHLQPQQSVESLLRGLLCRQEIIEYDNDVLISQRTFRHIPMSYVSYVSYVWLLWGVKCSLWRSHDLTSRIGHWSRCSRWNMKLLYFETERTCIRLESVLVVYQFLRVIIRVLSVWFSWESRFQRFQRFVGFVLVISCVVQWLRSPLACTRSWSLAVELLSVAAKRSWTKPRTDRTFVRFVRTFVGTGQLILVMVQVVSPDWTQCWRLRRAGTCGEDRGWSKASSWGAKSIQVNQSPSKSWVNPSRKDEEERWAKYTLNIFEVWIKLNTESLF